MKSCDLMTNAHVCSRATLSLFARRVQRWNSHLSGTKIAFHLDKRKPKRGHPPVFLSLNYALSFHGMHGFFSTKRQENRGDWFKGSHLAKQRVKQRLRKKARLASKEGRREWLSCEVAYFPVFVPPQFVDELLSTRKSLSLIWRHAHFPGLILRQNECCRRLSEWILRTTYVTWAMNSSSYVIFIHDRTGCGYAFLIYPGISIMFISARY